MKKVMILIFPFLLFANSMELFKNIESRDNIIFSPYSANNILNLLYLGANSKTKEELKLFKDRWSLNDSNFKEANGFFVDSNLSYKKEFKTLLDKNNAHIEKVNFSKDGVEKINLWVKSATESKIDKLFKKSEIDSRVKFVLTNAIYFKANWESKFTEVKKAEFTSFDGNKTEVDTMFLKGKFNYSSSKDFEVLELPYKDSNLSMYIVLPNDNLTDLKDIDINKLELKPIKLSISLPKFEFNSKIELKEPLMKIGAREAFSDNADFSNMTKVDVKLAKVIQKVYIKVDENGTEATASTGATFMLKSIQLERKFFVNKPFIFYIMDIKAKTPLFVGKIKKL